MEDTKGYDKHKDHSIDIVAFETLIIIFFIIAILAIIFLVSVAYYKGVFLFACCVYGIVTLFWKIFDIFVMIEIWIKKIYSKIWSKLKKYKIEYLGAVFQLSNIALSSPLLGGSQRWKASMVAGIAIFAILCYCGKVSVEVKRAKLTETFFYPETRNNKRVWFFTATHVLEFLIPLSYTLLACLYLTELDTKNHHMEKDWKSVAFSIQVFIHVIGGLLAFMNARSPYYFRQNDQNQMIPMQPIDTIPRKGNELVLKDKLVVAEELSEEVADVNVLEAAQGYVENQCADTDVSTIFAENVVLEVISEEGC